MRSLLFSSLLLAFLLSCKSEGAKKSEEKYTEPAATEVAKVQPEAEAPEPITVEQKMEEARQTAEEEAELDGGAVSIHRHAAPNQDYIDSVKAAKTKGKL